MSSLSTVTTMPRRFSGATRDELLTEIIGPGHNGLGGRFLRNSEVALLFQVSERTVNEWARLGRIPYLRTPGGHRLYPSDSVRDLLMETTRHDAPTPRGDP